VVTTAAKPVLFCFVAPEAGLPFLRATTAPGDGSGDRTGLQSLPVRIQSRKGS
jgi:hypothetical protein